MDKETTSTTPEWYLKLEAQYLEELQKQKEIENKIKSIKNSIIAMMNVNGLETIKSDLTISSYVKPIECDRFDSARFKMDHPQLFEQYASKYNRAGYLKITLPS